MIIKVMAIIGTCVIVLLVFAVIVFAVFVSWTLFKWWMFPIAFLVACVILAFEKKPFIGY